MRIATSTRRRALAGLAVAALAGSAGALPGAAAGAAGPPLLTTVYFRAISSPAPVLGADGRVHLAYELQVSNQSSLYVTLAEVQAQRTGGGPRLQRLRGARLGAVMRVNGDAKPGSTTLAPGGSGTIFLDATLPRGARVPPALEHRVRTIRAERPGGPPPEGTPRTARFTGVRVPVDRRPALVVQPPLRGADWVVGNGCCNVLNAHRGATLAIDGTAYVAERFAIDFVQLAPNGRLFNGPNVNSSYAYFGAPVYSAAPGRVVLIQNGQPEQAPGELPVGQTVETAGGNYVVVDLGGGRFAFYAHLQLGSLRVKVGDRVTAGQVLGLLGNTGNTDGAHLHFHVMDGVSPLTSNGVPYRFASFTGQGVVTDEAALVSGAVTPVDPSRLAGPRRNALPLHLEVVDFGPAP